MMERKTMAELKYHYGWKFRIYPSNKQIQYFINNSIVSRVTYNKLNELNNELYHLKKELEKEDADKETIQAKIDHLKYVTSTSSRLTKEFSWMRELEGVHSSTAGNAYRSYQNAWKQYKKVHNAGIPKFKKRTAGEKFQLTNGYSTGKECNLFTGKIRFESDLKHIIMVPNTFKDKKTKISYGRIRSDGVKGTPLEGKKDIRIGTVTISKNTTGQWFLAMQLASDTPFREVKTKTNKQIGIDLNRDNFCMISDGTEIANPRFIKRGEIRLKQEQKTLSRRAVRAKKEGRRLSDSKNYQKQRQKVAKIHQHIANQRDSFVHKLTLDLIENNDLIVFEELRSKNMMKNHALAQSIADGAWRKTIQVATYKADLYGKQVVTVDPKNTTQKCHKCGHVMGTDGTNKLTLRQREWTCPKCGTFHIRDLNASKNILEKGIAKISSEK